MRAAIDAVVAVGEESCVMPVDPGWWSPYGRAVSRQSQDQPERPRRRLRRARCRRVGGEGPRPGVRRPPCAAVAPSCAPDREGWKVSRLSRWNVKPAGSVPVLSFCCIAEQRNSLALESEKRGAYSGVGDQRNFEMIMRCDTDAIGRASGSIRH